MNETRSHVAQLRGQMDRSLTEGAVFAERLMRATAHYYSNIFHATLEYGQKVWRIPTSKTLEEASEPRQKPGIELHFLNCIGLQQQQEFLISNHRPTEVPVQFELSEFISLDGEQRTHVAVEFLPASLVLAPGQQRVIQCGIRPDGRMAADQPHMAIARVMSFPEMMIRLIVSPDTDAPTVHPKE